MTDNYEGMTLTIENGVAVLTLRRPDKLNALTPRMLQQDMPAALTHVAENPEARVFVLTGEGKGFCSGADVAGLAHQAGGKIKTREPLELRYETIRQLRTLSKPTIAAVNGMAAGAGLSLALACDMRIASDAARFNTVYVRRGLVPDAGASFFLPRLVGPAKALELLYTAETFGAIEAERIGMVNRTVPAADLMKATLDLAGRIAKGAPIALALTKRMLQRFMEQDLTAQLEYEAYNVRLCIETEDHQEGIKSFMEKREPQFKGK